MKILVEFLKIMRTEGIDIVFRGNHRFEMDFCFERRCQMPHQLQIAFKNPRRFS